MKLSTLYPILMFPITGCYSSDGHKYAQKLNEENPCPLTDVDPENPEEPILQYLKKNHKEELCCPCNPGEKLVELCIPGNYTSTICQPCEEGTFRKEYTHGFTYCEVDQLKCGPNSIYIPSKQEPRCDCLEGYYKASDGTCTPHSKCPPGEGVLNLGTRDSNTKCETCPEGYHSVEHSRTEKCSLKQSILNHPNNNHLNLDIHLTSDPYSQSFARSNSAEAFVATTNLASTNDEISPSTIDISWNYCINSKKVFDLGKIGIWLFCAFGVALIIIVLCHSKYKTKLFCRKLPEKAKLLLTSAQKREDDLKATSCSVDIDEEDNSRVDSKIDSTHETTSVSCGQQEERVMEFFMSQEHPRQTTSEPLLPVSKSTQPPRKTQSNTDLTNEISTTPRSCSECQRNRLSLQDNDLNRFSQQRTFHSNSHLSWVMELKKGIQNNLSNMLNWEQIQMVYRRFIEDENPEPYLEDLERKYTYSHERFIKIFTKLDSMANRKFNPVLLQNYLVEENIQNAADYIDEHVKKWKLCVLEN